MRGKHPYRLKEHDVCQHAFTHIGEHHVADELSRATAHARKYWIFHKGMHEGFRQRVAQAQLCEDYAIGRSACRRLNGNRRQEVKRLQALTDLHSYYVCDDRLPSAIFEHVEHFHEPSGDVLCAFTIKGTPATEITGNAGESMPQHVRHERVDDVLNRTVDDIRKLSSREEVTEMGKVADSRLEGK